MCRRRIQLNSVIHIGKETNELDENEILGLTREAYIRYANEETLVQRKYA